MMLLGCSIARTISRVERISDERDKITPRGNDMTQHA